MVNEFQGMKLLILGGMRISCEIIHKAKSMGIYTIVADYNKIEDSPGKKIADEHFLVSTIDVDEIVKLIKEQEINGVMVGFNDFMLPYYAEICKKSGLPSYGTKEQFDIFTNKGIYKKLCRKYNVPTVEEYSINQILNGKLDDELSFPVLVKPTDSSGAKGITVCQSKETLMAALKKAEVFSHSGQVLVERYVEGKEVTVFWLFIDGKYYLTAIGNRHVKQNQDGVIPLPVGYTFPAAVTQKYCSEIEKNVKNMLGSVGIQNGMMFMQCKVENEKCVVYDIGYRLTGSLEYKLLKEVCGYDPMEMMIRFALTGHMEKDSIADRINPRLGKYAFNVSVLTKPGRIGKISGIEDILNLPQVIDAVLAHYPGEEITDTMKGLLAQISLRVLGVSDSVETMQKTMLEIQKLIHIESDKGENMILPGIEEADFVNAFI